MENCNFVIVISSFQDSSAPAPPWRAAQATAGRLGLLGRGGAVCWGGGGGDSVAVVGRSLRGSQRGWRRTPHAAGRCARTSRPKRSCVCVWTPPAGPVPAASARGRIIGAMAHGLGACPSSGALPVGTLLRCGRVEAPPAQTVGPAHGTFVHVPRRPPDVGGRAEPAPFACRWVGGAADTYTTIAERGTVSRVYWPSPGHNRHFEVLHAAFKAAGHHSHPGGWGQCCGWAAGAAPWGLSAGAKTTRQCSCPKEWHKWYHKFAPVISASVPSQLPSTWDIQTTTGTSLSAVDVEKKKHP